ncbi:MAG TPA: DEAD/DEAH box helicase [Coleofasciculaceae cyanobacterium]|jgi:superfamily II RNA helicase
MHPLVAEFRRYLLKAQPNIKELDPKQIEAMNNLAEGHSNLVVMPTGSGKTLIPEFAIWQVLKAHSPKHPVRMIYTLPLVAVLGEKFKKFQERYGANNVGLMTGQETQNPDAPILLMTTEVWNMILSSPHDEQLIISGGKEEWRENLKLIQSARFVTLDEIHFLSNPDRGTVWESATTLAPPWMQSIYMSASVGNPEEIQGWLNELREQNRKRKTILPELNSPPAHLQGTPGLKENREVKFVQSFERSVPQRKLLLHLTKHNDPALIEIFQRQSNDDKLQTKLHKAHARIQALDVSLTEKLSLRDELIRLQDIFFKAHDSSELTTMRQEILKIDQEIGVARDRFNLESRRNEDRLLLKAQVEKAKKEQERKKRILRREMATGTTDSQAQAQRELHTLEQAIKRLQQEEYLRSDEKSQLERLLVNLKNQRRAASKDLVKQQKDGTAETQEKARRELEAKEQAFNELNTKLESMKKAGITSAHTSAGDHEATETIEPGLREATRQLESLQQERERLDRKFQAASSVLNRRWFSELAQSWSPRFSYETPPTLPQLDADIRNVQQEFEKAQQSLKTTQGQDWEYRFAREQRLLNLYQEALHNLMEKGKNPYGSYTSGQRREITRLLENVARQDARVETLKQRKELEENLPPVTKSFRDALRVATAMPAFDVSKVVKLLQNPPEAISKQSMTPALFVLYSRDKCKRLAEKLVSQLPETTLSDPSAYKTAQQTDGMLPLITEEERRYIENTIEKYIEKYPSLRITRTKKTKTPDGYKEEAVPHQSELLDWLRKGVAIHHRGLLPSERKLVEELLEAGKLKVVFGTDTLTVGLDSPFRTVVQWDVNRIGKLIDAADIVQTAGRAGRKGRHTECFYILPYFQNGAPASTFAEKLANYIDLITGSPEPIESQLDVSTYQILNLLSHHKPAVVEELIRRSLAAYQEKIRKNRDLSATSGPPQLETSVTSDLIQMFGNTQKCLNQLGFLERNGKLPVLGKIAAKIPGDNHLLIAKALQDGLFQTLTPENLAVLLSSLVTEPEQANALSHTIQRAQSPDEAQFYDTLEKLTELDKIMQRRVDTGTERNLPVPFINLDHSHMMRNWFLRKDLVALQRYNTRGDFFNVLKRTDNLISHILETLPYLEGTDLEKSTFQQSLQTVRKKIVSNEIRRMKSSS